MLKSGLGKFLTAQTKCLFGALKTASFVNLGMPNRSNHLYLQHSPLLLRYGIQNYSSCCHGNKKNENRVKPSLENSDQKMTTTINTTTETAPNTSVSQNFVNIESANTPTVSSSIPSSSSPTTTLSPWTSKFWQCKHSWKRASFNTLNCLIGCSIGDFGMLWFLTSQYPTLSMAAIMPICMASGIATSLALETTILKWKENFSSVFEAFKVACKMSFFSMAIMELSENVVDYAMMTYWGLISNDGTGCTSMLQIHEPAFWISLAASLSMGYLVPLPYNYYQLKKHGKSCH
ncbi:hypothetical protein C9374_004183 [Naegleria lovaniensis]|uniref:DUF4396 domain-containing protein n=1 Tax=Naegleria lovaniensis TaxID=51637 RepID=A0AA88GSF5_NAELO|nr:uncharacterized protein C9374_004183 [Naegleria lovaniensis]KAG2383512.1 hypothetical protein C9374_004183 [Naegleria lovaniensis]